MPTPSKSVRLQVLEKLVTVLQGMTDANAYHYPINAAASVQADPTFDLLMSNSIDLPAYRVEPQPDGKKFYYPGEQLMERFRVLVAGRYDVDASDPTVRQVAWENIAADVETAITADVTLGGLVCDVRLLVPEPFVGVGSNVVVLMQPLEITIYRHYGSP